MAKEFHSNVQDLLTKMAKCEESIGLLAAPSFTLDTVCTQLQEHRVGGILHSFCRCVWTFSHFHELLKFLQTLVNEVMAYGEKRTAVENAGRRLTELSRKEDCDIIHNLIMTVQDRYSKLHQRTAERGRMLEEVKKNTKQVGSRIRAPSLSFV